MAYRVNWEGTPNPSATPNQNPTNVAVSNPVGCFEIVTFKKDMSVSPATAQNAFFNAQMNIRRRQLVCHLNNSGVCIQKGAMQWFTGNITAGTGVKGVGDMFGKALRSSVTGEAAIKPEYNGTGLLVLEPTYKHILLEDLKNWPGGLVVDDGMFLASELTVKHQISRRNNLSSAVAGGEGLFNLCFAGSGVVALESPVPKGELICVDLQNDVLKIDGNMAVAWSGSLEFTVERTTKTLIGSAASGEGLVNVYRGSGRVLIAPVA